jgi:DNA-binding NtrC family response regulator
MGETWQIMVASSDLENRRNLMSTLDRQGLGAFCASNVSQCREILGKQNVGLVFCDRSFADGDYRDVLTAAASAAASARTRVVLLSTLADADQYKRAKEQGVFEVISAVCRPTDVEWMVIQARRDEQKRTASLLSAAVVGNAGRERARGASA